MWPAAVDQDVNLTPVTPEQQQVATFNDPIHLHPTSITTLKLHQRLWQPSSAPTKTCSDTETTQLWNRYAWVVEKEGLSGRWLMSGWDRGCRVGAIWLFSQHFWFEVLRVVNKTLDVTAFSLSFSGFVVQGPDQGPLHTRITEPWQQHIYVNTQRGGSTALSPVPAPLISSAA